MKSGGEIQSVKGCRDHTTLLGVEQAILFLELYIPCTDAFIFLPFLPELSLTIITELALFVKQCGINPVSEYLLVYTC